MITLELALDLALDRYSGERLSHIPGVSNIDAVALSRLHVPEPKPFPARPIGVPQAIPLDRHGADLWRASAPHPGHRLIRSRRRPVR